MHQATESDLNFVAERYVKIARHMKAGDQESKAAQKKTQMENARNSTS